MKIPESTNVIIGRLLCWLIIPAMLICFSLPASAGNRPERSSVWMGVSGGLTFNISILLDRASGQELELPASSDADASFEINLMYRTPRLDVGFLIQNFGGGAFQGLDRTRRIGGRARVAAALRWRFVEFNWGSFYLQFSPGVAFVNHHDHVRSQVATILGRQANQLGDIDTHSIGFGMGNSLGGAVYITQRLMVYLQMQFVILRVQIRDNQDEVGYLSVQPVLKLGLSGRI
jgi:hypothetical protein